MSRNDLQQNAIKGDNGVKNFVITFNTVYMLYT